MDHCQPYSVWLYTRTKFSRYSHSSISLFYEIHKYFKLWCFSEEAESLSRRYPKRSVAHKDYSERSVSDDDDDDDDDDDYICKYILLLLPPPLLLLM